LRPSKVLLTPLISGSDCIIIAVSGYIGEFEIVDDHRAGKIVVNLTGRLNKVHTVILAWSIVNRGDWSKEQTKMTRFMLEGPRPCTIFCFALIHYA